MQWITAQHAAPQTQSIQHCYRLAYRSLFTPHSPRSAGGLQLLMTSLTLRTRRYYILTSLRNTYIQHANTRHYNHAAPRGHSGTAASVGRKVEMKLRFSAVNSRLAGERQDGLSSPFTKQTSTSIGEVASRL
ncbi:hypothetical protein E2C01_004850 [Portunus trituberculatus]|uniref:Uncharacterized protein n=1 Tax=Portunus trituberculatus TaxID=210409 RepID=A0A5B7CR36_PORTR|nr:hypothetical protein [Portunus trituberculatus]